MGVRSSLLLLDQSGHASQGTAFALQMIMVALGIAVGLFASTLVVYPRKLQFFWCYSMILLKLYSNPFFFSIVPMISWKEAERFADILNTLRTLEYLTKALYHK